MIVVFATLAMFVFLAIAGLVLDTGFAITKKDSCKQQPMLPP
ncbi:hypothetical protein JCM19232_550 [Vibrio ishigakensis]|uniref:Uncharacterized protein n=1 Tax=Vibrio ishigakensis TaxID=1481914 RepID=A0A0B8P6N3_9VIBR|nr:hypothetical protein JCM19232_550 [Vibrio ishigakensis]